MTRVSSHPPSVLSWAGATPQASTLMFTMGWLVAGRLHSEYSARRDYISSLAAADAPNAWIMIAACVVFGLGVLSLGIGLYKALPDQFGRLGAVGVMAAGVGLVVTGLARHDCSLQDPACADRVSAGMVSGEHALHDVASISVFVIAGLSQLVIARSLRRRDGWRHLWLPSFSCSGLTLLLFALMISPALGDWTGALERGMALVSGLWVPVLARHLRRLRSSSRPVGLPCREQERPTPAPADPWSYPVKGV